MLYLIPNSLCAAVTRQSLPESTLQAVRSLRSFIVEDVRSARRFLSQLQMPVPIDGLAFWELNEHSTDADLVPIAEQIRQQDMGVISEAGVPGVADPGSDIVRIAHESGIRVIPLIGPSSILLAVMASGMNGQSFAFNGYLPVKQAERIATIKVLEKRSAQTGQTQIFIETPYRNQALWQDLITTCHPGTRIGIACDLTDPEHEFIATHTVATWKKTAVDWHKRPAVFLMHSSTVH